MPAGSAETRIMISVVDCAGYWVTERMRPLMSCRVMVAGGLQETVMWEEAGLGLVQEERLVVPVEVWGCLRLRLCLYRVLVHILLYKLLINNTTYSVVNRLVNK